MPSADDPAGPNPASKFNGEQVHSQLVEALTLLLIEKGVLTRNDALSIVQTVAEVQRGRVIEGGPQRVEAQAQRRDAAGGL